MANLSAQILSDVPNSGVVQLPGRQFPGVVVQGDSLSSMFDDLSLALRQAKAQRYEEAYYSILSVASRMQELLGAYEATLKQAATRLPYSTSISARQVHDDFAP